MPNDTYCCEFMRQQLEYDCAVHGKGCPDIVVQRCTALERQGEIMLVVRNAEYACNYCPSCGTKWIVGEEPVLKNPENPVVARIHFELANAQRHELDTVQEMMYRCDDGTYLERDEVLRIVDPFLKD
jgi:hypothetical protein